MVIHCEISCALPNNFCVFNFFFFFFNHNNVHSSSQMTSIYNIMSINRNVNVQQFNEVIYNLLQSVTSARSFSSCNRLPRAALRKAFDLASKSSFDVFSACSANLSASKFSATASASSRRRFTARSFSSSNFLLFTSTFSSAIRFIFSTSRYSLYFVLALRTDVKRAGVIEVCRIPPEHDNNSHLYLQLVVTGNKV
jgi:hypothetical protein